ATPKAGKIHRYRHSVLPAFTIGVWLLMLLTLLFGFARSFETPYIAMLVEQIIGLKEAAFWTGIISAFVSVGSMLSGIIIGYFSDRIRPLQLLIPIMAVTCITLFLQASATNLWVFGISRTVMFFVFGGSSAVLMKLMSNTTPKRKRGAVFGYRSTAHNIGSMIASFFAGWVVFICKDVRSAFYAAAILMLVLIPLTVWIIRRAMSQPFYIAHSPFRQQ
ncbi:MAG: MFS transporter, partial [Lentisphaerae bacterium]|nr:MFS transporter [Lentisphaerota bacterium]